VFQELLGGRRQKSMDKSPFQTIGKSKWKLINLMNRCMEALKRKIKNVGDMARRNRQTDNDERQFPYFE
jgi:hypothetical protein